MKTATFTVPMRVDVRYGRFDQDGTFSETTMSVVERTIGRSTVLAIKIAAVFGGGLLAGWLL